MNAGKTKTGGAGSGKETVIRQTTLKDPPALREARSPKGGASPAPLPIDRYDALSASEIEERLDGLALDALKAVEVHEGRHRRRESVVAAVRRARRKITREHATASF